MEDSEANFLGTPEQLSVEGLLKQKIVAKIISNRLCDLLGLKYESGEKHLNKWLSLFLIFKRTPKPRFI